MVNYSNLWWNWFVFIEIWKLCLMHVIKRRVRIWRKVCVHACVYDFTARCVWFSGNKNACCQLQCTHTQFILCLALYFILSRVSLTDGVACPWPARFHGTASAADTCIIHTLWFSCVKLILIEFLMMFFYLISLSLSLSLSANVYISFIKFTRSILHVSHRLFVG